MSESEVDSIEVFDTTIIGGGPVGLFGAFYAGLRGMKTKIIDSLPELGGQCNALYPEKYIYDMPAYPKVLAADLIRNLTEQAMRFSPTLALGETMSNLERTQEDTIKLTTNKGTHYTRTVIICAGAGGLSPRRLACEGAEVYEGRGVHYFVKKKEDFRGKNLLIVGGGDSALDWAMNLEPLANSIKLIHRNDRFRAHEDSIDWLLRRSSVKAQLFYEVKGVQGNGSLEAVTIQNSKTKEEETLYCDSLLVNIGFVTDIGPLKNFGLNIDKNKIVVDTHQQTNLPGVYAAGDICTFDGKLPLIATGVGEAATAVNYAKHDIDPKATINPGHSSHMPLSPTKPDAGHSLRDMAAR